VHVWRNLSEPGMHGPLEGFVRTKTRKCFPPDGNYGIYSLDGEMCFTTNGLEIIKLTVVGVEGRLVYETLILPDGEIVDYNTRFSGISARDLKKAQAKTLREVQVSSFLLSFLIFWETFLRFLRVPSKLLGILLNSC